MNNASCRVIIPALNEEDAIGKVIKDIPDDIPVFSRKKGRYKVTDLIAELGLAESKGVAKRLISQGGVQINGEKISDFNSRVKLSQDLVLKVGKRKFAKIVVED